MTPYSRRLAAAFLAVAGAIASPLTLADDAPAVEAGAETAVTFPVRPQPELSFVPLTAPAAPAQAPLTSVALKDADFNVACFKSANGFSCARPNPDAIKGLQPVTEIAGGLDVVAQRLVDNDLGIVCYANVAGLWCTSLTSKSPTGTTPAFTIETVTMGDMGLTSRITDTQTGLVVYANGNGISGAVRGADGIGRGFESIDFANAPVQRIRDYQARVVCYLAPAASKNFACATLAEDTTSNSDVRSIIKMNEPELRYSIIDLGSNGIIINVSDSGVCTAAWQPGPNAIKFVELDMADGKKATRIVDTLMGTVLYNTPAGLACVNGTAPKP